jgi:DNA-binding response OmpR family regulator
MSEINVLIVEDESIIAMEIESYLKKLKYTVVDICSNAKDTLQIFEDDEVNIVLMDICIKGDKDGIETAELIKGSHPDTEIIFLTAHMDDYNVDRAIALDPVAYLSKPFNREELRVFLKIATQKIQKCCSEKDKNEDHTVFDHEFYYNMKQYTLYCCNQPIHLTKKENELLDILVQNKNYIVDRYSIENTLWPDKEPNDNTINTLVRRLREKLKHKFIETVPSQGYRLTI